ncbi:hypothetical protein BDV98DRAFT_76252 [Pterulicium gracile]|uniref:Uncharacterized protein n=1 Tax=Pterulicium gracile TaxID=1884261 RepID=A0A5C3QHT7_9AGAR|nr:hypothetical protein BDV98DRAFT_76252 [Pterula gracilis]
MSRTNQTDRCMCVDCTCHVTVQSRKLTEFATVPDSDTSGFETPQLVDVLQFLQEADYMYSPWEQSQRRQPAARDLHRLQRLPATSERVWILLLRGAIPDQMIASGPTFSTNVESGDGPVLASWLSHLESDYQQTRSHFSALSFILLSAYICQWTCPEGVILEHHPLLAAALTDAGCLSI